MILLTIFVTICFNVISSLPISDNNGAWSYLLKFGYHEEAATPGALLDLEKLTAALIEFQKFGGLQETGVLNDETINLMNTPRCGFKDIFRQAGVGRKKRYTLAKEKWPRNNLTYKITKYSKKIKSKTEVDHEVKRAFKLWSDETKLSFKEAGTEDIDVNITFVVRDHGDEGPFEGVGGPFAHAFLPQDGGDAHFDDEQKWTINERTDANLHHIAAHEFGHSLGLLHSRERKALMYPYYAGYDPELRLSDDDIRGIQRFYGQPSSTPPDLCKDASIDAMTQTQDGSTYVFKGNFYWQVLDNALATGYPKKISDDWGRLEGNLDACLTTNDGKTFCFKGGRYWRTTNKKIDNGFPKTIAADFRVIPDLLDASFFLDKDRKAYFFKADQYWLYEPDKNPPGSADPALISVGWPGIPDSVDEAFVWKNNASSIYFFKGDQYYRFDNATSSVPSDYPKSTAKDWFGC